MSNNPTNSTPPEAAGGGDDDDAPPRMKTLAEARAERGERGGLRCPKCWCGDSRVVYKRKVAGSANNRRRECAHCGHRFTTREERI